MGAVPSLFESSDKQQCLLAASLHPLDEQKQGCGRLTRWCILSADARLCLRAPTCDMIQAHGAGRTMGHGGA